ncbi:hypothetical protein AU210_013282 [Fusarium oxysporum f. sp. radicis-cucumerinum]|uniref:Uncharacterized protein n=1 Tax=Fusarium oxysporum f. sp. radicis-cucumerinum TaxID=327505 RepID=A0A2H3GRU2_FUSOX|nr:hypothetical protein AU210_013282 [Fusarium oxysporum f. sp. radicis-cucumerinum]
MVYLSPSQHGDCLKCYLATPFTDEELEAFKAAFELGACSKFAPLMQLKILHAPEDYLGKSHQYIRAKETEAGNKDPFIVVDDEAKSRGAVWYIDQFAEEDQVEDGEAESTDVVFKILTQTEALAVSHINYAIANSSIGEDLDNCAVDLPLTNDFHQPELNDCGGLDFEQQQWEQDAWVIAEPGEFEESTNPELLNNFSPPPEKVARLKDDVAESIGLVSSWTIPSNAEPIDLEDGTKKEFPEGSVVLQQKYNPEFPWPADSL